ncbi:hypothetical protein BDK51DRAFT_49560 [Blyttiomyces helicus]|uniref:Uncharacterized protein n=1 Tax=Blyttiomyces helicus TaxID=388810 RepID=A0A4P9VYA1_9FUNG|nr:hypothetical protein BDK51DRAFT_49560 [Blyttiomyces helicus]|eukprot:RKO83925.1 hypothetical protein BDK51DRAFT_49560 [Blyttiomyces helicus]
MADVAQEGDAEPWVSSSLIDYDFHLLSILPFFSGRGPVAGGHRCRSCPALGLGVGSLTLQSHNDDWKKGSESQLIPSEPSSAYPPSPHLAEPLTLYPRPQTGISTMLACISAASCSTAAAFAHPPSNTTLRASRAFSLKVSSSSRSTPTNAPRGACFHSSRSPLSFSVYTFSPSLWSVSALRLSILRQARGISSPPPTPSIDSIDSWVLHRLRHRTDHATADMYFGAHPVLSWLGLGLGLVEGRLSTVFVIGWGWPVGERASAGVHGVYTGAIALSASEVAGRTPAVLSPSDDRQQASND